MGNVILFVSCILCGVIFLGLGVSATKRKPPRIGFTPGWWGCGGR